MASMLRKQSDSIKEHLFPAMFQMIAEPELQDELEEWLTQENVEDIAKNDPSSVAKTALDRISSAIGEKQTLANIQILIQGAVQQERWQHRFAGYVCIGMISAGCKNTFKKNMDEIMQLAAKGLMDSHPRVRFEALTSLGLLLTELAPKAQKKFHPELVPLLVKMAMSEEHLKLQTRAISSMVCFVRGLLAEHGEEEEEEGKVKNG